MTEYNETGYCQHCGARIAYDEMLDGHVCSVECQEKHDSLFRRGNWELVVEDMVAKSFTLDNKGFRAKAIDVHIEANQPVEMTVTLFPRKLRLAGDGVILRKVALGDLHSNCAEAVASMVENGITRHVSYVSKEDDEPEYDFLPGKVPRVTIEWVDEKESMPSDWLQIPSAQMLTANT